MAKIANVNGIAGTEEQAGIIIIMYELIVKRMTEVSCISHYIKECQCFK